MHPFTAGSGLSPEVFWGRTSNSPVETPFTTRSLGSGEHGSQEPLPIGLPQLFSPSLTHAQLLEQRIIQLDNENAQLKLDIRILNTENNTLSNAYEALLDRVPNTTNTSFPDTTNTLDPFVQADHPNVNFWFRRNWLELKNADHDGANMSQPLRGRSRSSKGINVAMRYIEDRDGRIVDGDRVSAIRDFARAVWEKLRKKGPMPASWGVADSDTRKIFYYEMAQRFYELRLCELDWKADQIAKETYSRWHTERGSNDIAANSKNKRLRTGSIKMVQDLESKRHKANAEGAIVDDNTSRLPFVMLDSSISEPCLPFMATVESDPDFGIPNLASMGSMLSNFPMAMAPELITPSTSVPFMMAVGSGDDIGAIHSSMSILSSYSKSTGVTGMPLGSTAVIPSMVEPQPKPTKMRPGKSDTARSLCSQDWCRVNNGSTDDFKIFYDQLPASERKRYEEVSADKRLEKRRAQL